MTRAAVVFRVDRARTQFLPALVVTRIGPIPPLGRVPGAPPELAGMAQTENEILPVVDLRDKSITSGVLLVCSYMTETLGVIVGEVIGVSHYEIDPEAQDSILVGDARVRALDLGKIYARLQSASFVSRVVG
jgi:chemotaxis signal transduction protein